MPATSHFRAVALLSIVIALLASGVAAWALLRSEAQRERAERLQQQAHESERRIRALEEELAARPPQHEPTPANKPPAPPDAYEVYVVAKQWAWKFQHPNGVREMGTLCVPAGRAISLRLTSEDVPHSFTVPELNIAIAVRPGQETTTWFRAEKPGRYTVACGENCGEHHAQHKGTLVILEPREFEDYLRGFSRPEAPVADHTAAWKGQQLFRQLMCGHCHADSPMPKAPSLNGLYGSTVPLHGGKTATADEAYLRESILQPHAKVRMGWAQGTDAKSDMPQYRIGPASEPGEGTITAEDLNQLIAYLKTLKTSKDRNERLEPLNLKPMPKP